MNERSTERDAVERMLLYYQGFHHTCVTWYITTTGILVAGLIAVDGRIGAGVALGILVVGLLLGITFVATVVHFADRIRLLNEYLALPEVPPKWRDDHKKQKGFFSKLGVGTEFFIAILVTMQFALWWLTAAKYCQ